MGKLKASKIAAHFDDNDNLSAAWYWY